MKLYEKYRPKTWSEVIGQDDAIATIQAIAQSEGIAGNCFWLSGKSGSGKTTLAYLITAEVSDDYEELDGKELSAARLDSIRERHRYRSFGKGGHAVIINEAHGIRDATRMLGVLEGKAIPPHVVWIFTTTVQGQRKFEGMEDAAPFLSRCVKIKLSQRDLMKPFAARLREIAQAEGLDGKPIGDYEKLLYDCKCNFRAAIQAVARGGMKP